MNQIGTEGIVIIVCFLAVCFGAIIWGRVRKAHGKSDRLTSSVIDDVLESKPYRTLVKAEIIGYGTERFSGKATFTGAFVGALTGKNTIKYRGNTTFRLTYEDGHTVTEKVMDHTQAWEKYMKLASGEPGKGK